MSPIPTCRQALKTAAREVAIALGEAYLWDELWKHTKGVLWALLAVCARTITLLTYPISVPLLAIAVRLDAKKTQAQAEKAKSRIKAHYEKLMQGEIHE